MCDYALKERWRLYKFGNRSHTGDADDQRGPEAEPRSGSDGKVPETENQRGTIVKQVEQ